MLINSPIHQYKTFVLFWGAYHAVSTVPYLVQVRNLSSHQRTSKRGLFVHTSLSTTLSLSLSLSSQSFLAFVFYSISAFTVALILPIFSTFVFFFVEDCMNEGFVYVRLCVCVRVRVCVFCWYVR